MTALPRLKCTALPSRSSEPSCLWPSHLSPLAEAQGPLASWCRPPVHSGGGSPLKGGAEPQMLSRRYRQTIQPPTLAFYALWALCPVPPPPPSAPLPCALSFPLSSYTLHRLPVGFLLENCYQSLQNGRNSALQNRPPLPGGCGRSSAWLPPVTEHLYPQRHGAGHVPRAIGQGPRPVITPRTTASATSRPVLTAGHL